VNEIGEAHPMEESGKFRPAPVYRIDLTITADHVRQ